MFLVFIGSLSTDCKKKKSIYSIHLRVLLFIRSNLWKFNFNKNMFGSLKSCRCSLQICFLLVGIRSDQSALFEYEEAVLKDLKAQFLRFKSI